MTDLQIVAKRGGQPTLNLEQALIAQATTMLIRGDGASASLQALYEHEARITTQGGGRDAGRDVRVNASVSVQCGHPQPVAVA